MFKVGDRVVAIGGSYMGRPNESMAKQIKNKTVLTVTEVHDYRTAGFSITCKDMASSELQGFFRGSGWTWRQSELRYATEEEIEEADKVEGYSFFGPVMGLSDLIGDGKPFTSMSNPGWESMSPDDFGINSEKHCDNINVVNNGEWVELSIEDDCAFLEPQEARATAKALCEHADYVERMKEKKSTALEHIRIGKTDENVVLNVMGSHMLLKPVEALTVSDKLRHEATKILNVPVNTPTPKQPVFKIWKEGVKDEEGVVWLRLMQGYGSAISLNWVYGEGSRKLGGTILSITPEGELSLHRGCIVPGIQTDSDCRIKEVE